MTDPGLNQRLRQRSRRSGLMIGLSMLLTLVVCVGTFTFIYAKLEPIMSDFVGRGDIEVPTTIPTQPAVAVEAAPTTETATDETPQTPTAVAGGDNQKSEENKNTDKFVPDYQVSAGRPVNLRPGPGVGTGDALIAVPEAAPLMFLDEEKATADPGRDEMETGQVWMKFRTNDGIEGWIRELDVATYRP